MTIPFICVLFLIILTYLSKAPVALAMAKQGGYDNRHPREQQSKLTGWGRRAVAAHQNGFEALSVFAPCVLINHLSGGAGLWADRLAIFYLISRVAYVGLYIADLHLVRSVTWMAGLLAALGLALLVYLQ